MESLPLSRYSGDDIGAVALPVECCINSRKKVISDGPIGHCTWCRSPTNSWWVKIWMPATPNPSRGTLHYSHTRGDFMIFTDGSVEKSPVLLCSMPESYYAYNRYFNSLLLTFFYRYTRSFLLSIICSNIRSRDLAPPIFLNANQNLYLLFII
jgi:hypothetical protein